MENTRESSIKDIAQKAKVSIGTVDRVIHERVGVSEKTTEKALKIIAELNYKPNILASNLARKKVFHIDVIFLDEDSNSSYSLQLLKGIEKAKNEIEQFSIKIEFKIIHLKTGNRMNDFYQISEDERLNGCIVINRKGSQIKEFPKQCERNKLPYVLIGEDLNDSKALCKIEMASYDTGKLAGQLFDIMIKDGSLLIVTQQEVESKKVKGLLDYLAKEKSQLSIEKLAVNTKDVNIKRALDSTLKLKSSIKGIYIPDFNVNLVAAYLEKRGGTKIHLIGCDFIEENKDFIARGIIDFLISQKSDFQGYIAMQNLFKHFVLNTNYKQNVTMPLDIITKQNYNFY